MNRATQGMAVKHRWRWSLLGLCGGVLLACGGGHSDPLAPKVPVLAALLNAVAPTPPDAAMAAASATDAARGHSRTYSVIQLGAGEITELPVINSSNQVAFSLNGANGARAAFFNGKTVRDIGTLGGVDAYAPALNEAGQVAGYAANASGNYHAFRWSPAAGMRDLGTLYGDPASTGRGINAQGQVAGYSAPAVGPLHAFVWSDGSGMRDLGRLGSGLGSASAQAINERGMVAGASDAPDGNAHAFAWSKASGMLDLGTLGGIDSFATLINNAGQVAGYSAVDNAAGFNYHGFVWSLASGMRDIGTLSGLGSAALAMNARGQVAGVADKDAQYQHAVWWTRDSGLVDLGTLAGTMSRALGINRYGVVVGWSNTPAGQFDDHAFLWTQEQGMLDLNTRLVRAPAGLVVTQALAIADSGAIVADSNAGLVLLIPGVKGHDAPVVGPIIGPISPASAVPAGTRVAFSAGFIDQNGADTHTAKWTWGEHCAASVAAVSERGGVGTVRGQHTFCTAGVHVVTLTVTDSSGLSATVARDVVVDDASAATLSGAGQFLSPPGAYKKDAMYAGRASFSVVAAASLVANAVANRPADQAMLKFHVATLNFQSDAYQLLSVAAGRAEYQGSGTLNGRGNHAFLLTALDGSAGGQARLRIKIWHRAAPGNAEVVDYDNQRAGGVASGNAPAARAVQDVGQMVEGSAIGAGSIVTHR